MEENAATGSLQADVINASAIMQLLGIKRAVPLSAETMAKKLRVTFFPPHSLTFRLEGFVRRLDEALRESGVEVLAFEDALQDHANTESRRKEKGEYPGQERRRLQEGVVVIAAGELETGNLPVDYVSSLRSTTVVEIIDAPCPGNAHTDMQEKLNSIVRTLTWNLAQVLIFVEDDAWTICTMNGAIIPCRDWTTFRRDVQVTLVPKLAAPVVPPHASDYDFDDHGLDLTSSLYADYAQDFKQSGPLWGKTGLMLFHTSLESLQFRSPFYKRVAAAYLDRRSGMSYGFLARQVATPVTPALKEQEADALLGGCEWRQRGYAWIANRFFVATHLKTGSFLVEVPDVSVLSTRSGCDKSRIDAERDLMLMTLSRGRIGFKTPKSSNGRIDYRPSYDTLTILAHALGNALIAGVQLCIDAHSTFARTLQKSGLALAHWHGTIKPHILPPRYSFHGDQNPPVSCSTHQAAIYALAGKLRAFRTCVEQGVTYEGDVHVEPHHGINVTWPTLTGLAKRLLQANGVPAETAVAANIQNL
jgi:hypothetical protein